MNQVYQLEEGVVHGTLQLPFSIHHTYIRKNQVNILYLHWHQEYEFLLVKEGSAVFHIGDKDYIVNANEGLFIPSNVLHSATSLDGSTCSFYAFVFHMSFLAENNNKSSVYTKYIKPLLTGKIAFTVHFTCKQAWQKRAITLLDEMAPYFNTDLSESELILKSKIYEIWYLFYTNHEALPEKAIKKSKSHHRFETVLNFIHLNYAEYISLKVLADMLSISESQFCRSFKTETTMSPFDYIIRYRILKSCSHLSQTNEKIATIANLVGFNNISYYNKKFKLIIGCSPSEYRKM